MNRAYISLISIVVFFTMFTAGAVTGVTTAHAQSTTQKPATQASACGAGTTYTCVSCGVTPSQLPCAVSAGCTTGTTGACVPSTNTTAASSGNCSRNTLCNPLKVNSIEELVLAIIDVVLIFLLPVIILYIMYAGFLFVKANGNPEGISQAKKALLTALIGGVIVMGARAILDVVKGTIESVTGTELSTTASTGSTSGSSGNTSGTTGTSGGGTSGGSSGNTAAADTTFSNYAAGSWTGSGVNKVPTTETMPQYSFNTYYSKACSVCYADFKTLASGTNRCLTGKGLPVGTESFESMCTRYKGMTSRESTSLVNYTAGGEQYIKYICWVNPSVTTDCSTVSRYSYYQ